MLEAIKRVFSISHIEVHATSGAIVTRALISTDKVIVDGGCAAFVETCDVYWIRNLYIYLSWNVQGYG